MFMRTIEILLVEQSDDGQPMDRPTLLVNERLYRGESHPNGVLFRVPILEPAPTKEI
jgi:hypothetical protein